MLFEGQLVLTIHKAHGWYRGMPFIGNAARRPRVGIVLAGARAFTSHWPHAGLESQWEESFMIHVHNCDGAAVFHFNVYFELEGVEHLMATFFIELASLLSHTGVQWYQIRSRHNAHDHHSIRGEVNVEAQWFVDGAKVPDAVRQSVRAVVSTTDPPPSSDRSPTASTSTSRGMTQSTSLPSISSLVITSEQALEIGTKLVLLNPHLDQRQIGLFPSPATVDDAAESHEPSSLLPQPAALQKSPSMPLTLAAQPSTLPPTPFVYSGPIYGRIHADTQFFDDHNFLELHAGLAQVLEVFVFESRAAILGLQFVWSIRGVRIAGNKHRHAAAHGSPSVLMIEPGEVIVSIGIKHNEVGITALTFVTTRQRRSFGAPRPTFDELGDDCVAQCPPGSRVVCVTGGFNESHGLNNIGIYYQQVDGSQPVSPAASTSASPSIRNLGTLSKQNTSKKISAV